MNRKALIVGLCVAAVVTTILAWGPVVMGGSLVEAAADQDEVTLAPDGELAMAAEMEAQEPRPALEPSVEAEVTPDPSSENLGPGAEDTQRAEDDDGAAAQAAPTKAEPRIVEKEEAAPVNKISAGAQALSAKIHNSLYQTFAEKLPRGTADPLTAVVARLMVWWLNPERDLRKGDAISIVFEDADPEPRVLALKLKSEKGGRTFEAYAFTPEEGKAPRYFDAEGREIEGRLLASPIGEYDQITSKLSDGRGHQGIDFRAPIGSAVVAPFAGTISRVNWSTRRNGNCLDLAGPKGFHALFLHLDQVEAGIRPGVKVKQGQVIARSGNTGHSTAPHLHYQLQLGKKVVDPFDAFPSAHQTLPPSKLEDFKKERDLLRKKLKAF